MPRIRAIDGNEGGVVERVGATRIGRVGRERIVDGLQLRRGRCRADHRRIDRAVRRRVVRHSLVPTTRESGRSRQAGGGQTLRKARVGIELHLVGDVEAAIGKKRITGLRRAQRGICVVVLPGLHDVRCRGRRSVLHRRVVRVVHTEAVAGGRTDATLGGERAVVGVQGSARIEVVGREKGVGAKGAL